MSSLTNGSDQIDEKLSGYLRKEHRVILKILDSFQAGLEEALPHKEMISHSIKRILEISDSFIDKNHMRKEDECLLPALRGKDAGRLGQHIKIVTEEHKLCRSMLGGISEKLRSYEEGILDANELVSACIEYIELMRQHIFKEDKLLLPIIESTLSGESAKQVVSCYEEKGRDLEGILRDISAKWDDSYAAPRGEWKK